MRNHVFSPGLSSFRSTQHPLHRSPSPSVETKAVLVIRIMTAIGKPQAKLLGLCLERKKLMGRAILRFYPRKLHLWTIISVDSKRMAKVRCACKRRRTIRLSLLRKHVKSCGCWKREAARKQIAINRPAINARLTHGGTTPELIPLYRVYRRMLQRCSNPRVHNFKNYGGRGITVAPEWAGPNGFSTWLRQMGPRPRKCTLDRVDNDGPYAPWNCRWASRKTQRANQRPRKRAA